MNYYCRPSDDVHHHDHDNHDLTQELTPKNPPVATTSNLVILRAHPSILPLSTGPFRAFRDRRSRVTPMTLVVVGAASTGVARVPKTEFQENIQMAKALSRSLAVAAPAAADAPEDSEVSTCSCLGSCLQDHVLFGGSVGIRGGGIRRRCEAAGVLE